MVLAGSSRCSQLAGEGAKSICANFIDRTPRCHETLHRGSCVVTGTLLLADVEIESSARKHDGRRAAEDRTLGVVAQGDDRVGRRLLEGRRAGAFPSTHGDGG